ncbi:MAG: hypothetical protein AAGK14_03040 [Verrucomicrobiota bacterium]
MICYAFAVPHESEGLLEQMQGPESFDLEHVRCTVGLYKDRLVLCAVLGMGMQRAAKGAELVLEYFQIKAFILAGYAGALVPQLAHGDVVVSDNFSSDNVISFVRLLPDFKFAKFCSSDELVATPQRRQEFHEATECQVVDMETGGVAETVHGRGVTFAAVRVISDTMDDVLPVGAMNAAYDAERNRPRPVNLGWYLMTHPGESGSFKAFVARLAPARESLTKFLSALTDEMPKGI